ncbi:S-layer homology domain-containing protein [Brevibacillus ruminantium]|uniref:S-layer homology domain-containing protein n=1 Tax=Brevibacillus ruminantium TaxID=2950604 RepID=A0ABY4WHL3_9BACL|nr:S-layer homology domain-containing protein [Brevibacillus ruminantium]USG66194.1 S-layer homology domain-containing protein [Brevibacillus ruminantium]
MVKRSFVWFFVLSLCFQALFVPAVSAAYYEDVQGHWAQREIEELSNVNVYRLKYGNFYPDNPMARGEALVLLNRVLESVYGPLGVAKSNSHIDHRYSYKQETEQLAANMHVMLNVQTGFVNSFDPGDSMLYYLHLSERGGMKQPQKKNGDWWLSDEYLHKPLTREEASMILFHVLAPYKMRTSNFRVDEVEPYFSGYYQWKQDRKYVDTDSPYAAAIADFNLFVSEKTFEPNKQMTRAQFAVVLKRLYDFCKNDAPKQFHDTAAKQKAITNLFLTAADRAYQQRDQEQIDQFFSRSAQRTLEEIAPLPLHDYAGNLTLNKDENHPNRLWAKGSYQHPLTGSYQVTYMLEPASSNHYGWQVTKIEYQQK